MGAVKITVLHSTIIEAMKIKLKFLKRIRNYLKNKILVSIIHYAGGKNFLLLHIRQFKYAKFSFWSLIVLIIEENIIKIKGKENEKTNIKAINCLI